MRDKTTLAQTIRKATGRAIDNPFNDDGSIITATAYGKAWYQITPDRPSNFHTITVSELDKQGNHHPIATIDITHRNKPNVTKAIQAILIHQEINTILYPDATITTLPTTTSQS